MASLQEIQRRSAVDGSFRAALRSDPKQTLAGVVGGSAAQTTFFSKLIG